MLAGSGVGICITGVPRERDYSVGVTKLNGGDMVFNREEEMHTMKAWFDIVGRIQSEVQRDITECRMQDYLREVQLRRLDTHISHAKAVLQEIMMAEDEDVKEAIKYGGWPK